MGWTITNIWNLLTYDVEDTVYHVCKQVLDEEDIPKDMRTTRAAAIKEIGVIFQVYPSALTLASLFHNMATVSQMPCSFRSTVYIILSPHSSQFIPCPCYAA